MNAPSLQFAKDLLLQIGKQHGLRCKKVRS